MSERRRLYGQGPASGWSPPHMLIEPYLLVSLRIRGSAGSPGTLQEAQESSCGHVFRLGKFLVKGRIVYTSRLDQIKNLGPL